MFDYDEKKRLTATGWCVVPKFLCGLRRLYGDAQRIRRAVAAVREQQRRRQQDCDSADTSAEQEQQQSVDSDEHYRPGCGSGLPSWLSGLVEAGLEEKAIFNEINHLHGAHKAAAIMWAFTVYELCKAPEWQQILGGNGGGP